MAIIISGITLPFTEPAELAIEEAMKQIKGTYCTKAVIAKKSIDARRKNQIKFVYSVAVEIEGDEKALVAQWQNPKITVKKDENLLVAHGSSPLKTSPIIVGFGPAGMFAGLLLAREGYRPLILERGVSVDQRVEDVNHFWKTGILNAESNVQFGEGGAGTFSDGKLTTRIGDPRCSFILNELVRYGAPEEIKWNAKPHVGTDKLRHVVKNIRKEIIRLGGEISFGERLEDITLGVDGSIKKIITNRGEREAQILLLALGHSARDTFEMLKKRGIVVEAKAFSVGVRIEHLQAEIDRMLYGNQAGNPLLPKGEYQLSHREGTKAVYTFCMCPGGVVVPAASSEGMLTTNGMSAYARNEINANSALVVSVNQEDFGTDPLAGVHFQQELERAAFQLGKERFIAPAQTVDSFLEGKSESILGRVKPSYARGICSGDFGKVFSPSVVNLLKIGLKKFDNKLRGFADKGALLTGVETRTSSPLRIVRKSTMESVNTIGLYPCGEGAGYAGGIMSAGVDGLRAAGAIIEEFSENDKGLF